LKEAIEMKSKFRTLVFLSTLALMLVPLGMGTGAAGQGKGERVPPNSSYIVVNKKGEKVREYGPGESMPYSVDCVQIRCPAVLITAGGGKKVRCWRCGKN
jgi:hypothetical protein